jgi:GAF domain-containing protein
VNHTALDHITRLAGRELNAPVVCISLVDVDRRLVTGSYGLPEPTALLVSWWFMKRVVAARRPLVVTDGRRDPVAARNPAVRDGTVTAYIGTPLIASSGRALGTLSVMDRRPRRWSAPQLDFLRRLSARVVKEVEDERVPVMHRESRAGGPATTVSVR